MPFLFSLKSVLRSWFSVLSSDQLYYRTFSPAIFFAGEISDGAVQLGIGFGGHNAGTGCETFAGNAQLHFRVDMKIPQPVRGGVFGDQVEASITMGEPDFDFAGQTTAPASSGEIEILLAVEAIGL
jgi:hypothetical protein